ncbi:MAG: flagellar basal body rod protein FlgB [Gammaproteobacteria bacterium]|nr:flagellar basal body rod protein FlgB [Gammaproteobacteria bacterium]MCP5202309.1 flagellar basal body rod protein FlgB [Gammaproteobacteria bacterium]
MPSFDDALGIHASAVALRVRRAEILAANLANADTPGYQARDLDFRAALAAAAGPEVLARTQAGHLGAGGGSADYALQYRQPLHASIDQNTVDVQAERAAFLDNAVRYQASMTFLNGRIAGLVSALRGE